MEIERKFLCSSFDYAPYPHLEYFQSYISTSPTIRIRREGEKHKLTIKGKGSISREEYEIDITAQQFIRLLKKTEPGSVSKTRYFVPLANGLTAELDIYHNELEGLQTVEVEFESTEQAQGFIPPTWFGKELTGDKRFSNASLAKKGIPGDLLQS